MKIRVRCVQQGIGQSRACLSGLLLLLLSSGCATQPKGGRATLEFRQPDRFSDLQIPGMSREKTVAVVLPRLQQAIEADAQNSIPAGYVVHIVLTEIDQAGFIPNPGAAFPIRITGDNSAAIVAFDYSVDGPTGQAVKTGNQRLMQTPESLGPFMDDDSPVPLIEYMLNDWMGSLGWELSHAQK